MVLTFRLCNWYDLATNSDFALHKTSADWFFITEVESVYCAVRTESLYNTAMFSLWRVKGQILSVTPYQKHALTKLPVSVTAPCAPNLATLPLYALQLVTVYITKNTLYPTLHVKYKISC